VGGREGSGAVGGGGALTADLAVASSLLIMGNVESRPVFRVAGPCYVPCTGRRVLNATAEFAFMEGSEGAWPT
jgi:hypothetical protein